jgi:hypothetical protein
MTADKTLTESLAGLRDEMRQYVNLNNDAARWCAQLDAILAGSNVPEGWKLVPVEPTKEMISIALAHLGVKGYWREDAKPIGSFYSGHTAAEAELVNWDRFGKDRLLAAYAAMLAAAPAQENGDG